MIRSRLAEGAVAQALGRKREEQEESLLHKSSWTCAAGGAVRAYHGHPGGGTVQEMHVPIRVRGRACVSAAVVVVVVVVVAPWGL